MFDDGSRLEIADSAGHRPAGEKRHELAAERIRETELFAFFRHEKLHCTVKVLLRSFVQGNRGTSAHLDPLRKEMIRFHLQSVKIEKLHIITDLLQTTAQSESQRIAGGETELQSPVSGISFRRSDHGILCMFRHAPVSEGNLFSVQAQQGLAARQQKRRCCNTIFSRSLMKYERCRISVQFKFFHVIPSVFLCFRKVRYNQYKTFQQD